MSENEIPLSFNLVNTDVILQITDAISDSLPPASDFEAWAGAALGHRTADTQITIRIVDKEEGAALNQRWRGKDSPTNVLSFPCEGLEQIAPELLGDLVICAPVVKREAMEQDKSEEAHWAHMTIHGILHLLGYDHENNEEAVRMEAIETEILAGLNFADPYRQTTQDKADYA